MIDTERRRGLAAILLKVGTAQALIQLVQIATGIWIIRATSKAEYAYYTIANTLLFTILLLADSGVTASLSAAGGKAWHDRRRLGSLLLSALRMRRDLSLIVTAVLIPLLIGLLIRNGASLPRAASIAVIIAATVVGELTIHTYLVVFRLRRQFDFTQRVALFGAAGRMIWLALWSAGRLRAEFAILASSVNTLIQWLWFRRRIDEHADLGGPRDLSTDRDMKNVISRQIPLNIYYCLQGQLAIWLASTFGSPHEVSDMGALGRFAALFTVSQAVIQEVVLPAFARAQSPRIVFKRYFQITAGYIGFLAIAVFAILIFRRQALAVLGHQYSWLAPELPLAMAYCSVNALTQVLWGLNYSRAWILPAVPYIAVTTLLQLALFRLFHAYSVDEILRFTVLSLLPAVIFPVWLSLRKMRGLERDEELVTAELTHA